MSHFWLRFDEDNTFESSVLDEVVIVGGEELPTYQGETDITPKPREDILLETANTRVLDNIIVREIPYYETSNISGKTVYIGGN